MPSKTQLMNAASAALKAQRWEEARRLLSEAKLLTPFDPDILYNLGIVAHQLGDSHGAITWWKQTLGADPRNVAALANIGAVLFNLGHEHEGLRHTIMAVERDPRNLTLLINLALAWMKVGGAQPALEAIDKAMALSPRHVHLLTMRLECLTNLARYNEARAVAIELLSMHQPAIHPDALCVLVDIAAQQSDWPTLAIYQDHVRQAAVAPGTMFNPTMFMFGTDDPQLLFEVGAMNPESRIPTPRPARSWSSGRICIGYLSADFREHPVAQMLLAVLQHHDRKRFRIVLVNAAPIDDSPVARLLLANVDAQVDITADDTLAARQRVLASGIDVLIDLSGTTQGNRQQLLQTRPCPAQLLWLGCPTTTGKLHYDALMIDSIVAPPGYDTWCHEPLLRLPCCYHPISAGLDSGGSQLTRDSLGIPRDAVLVGMLQMPNRVRPPFIQVVVGVLARHPAVHLILRVIKDSQDQVLAQLAASGLPAGRVSFAPRFPERSDYLQLLRHLDLMIDSHPYGGHSTSGEAMSLGTPVLTLAGTSIHTRVAASMLHELGLGDLATHSMPQFSETLDALLGDPTRLAEWKRRFTAARAQPADQRHRRLAAALESSCETVLRAAPLAGLTTT